MSAKAISGAATVLRRPPVTTASSSYFVYATLTSRAGSRCRPLVLECSLSPWFGFGNMQQQQQMLRLSLKSRRLSRREKKGRCSGKVSASLFGVGAPEALVIGVVALLVFGPKGLAEVARNLGKTLRAFQPTIKELQDVSREFRSTLEQEIGLDEISSSTNYKPTGYANDNQQAVVDPNGKPTTSPYTGEEVLKIIREQQSAPSAAAAQMEASGPSEESQASTPDVKATASLGETDISAAAIADSDNSSQVHFSEKAEDER